MRVDFSSDCFDGVCPPFKARDPEALAPAQPSHDLREERVSRNPTAARLKRIFSSRSLA
jgi:hypothetical protein